MANTPRAPETWCPLYPLDRHSSGFWLSESILPGVDAMRSRRFTARPDDVVVASFPASAGTAWLKAMAFAVVNRDRHPPSHAAGHPLRRRSPHECVRFLEMATDDDNVFADLPSPRVLATNLPYRLLPECVTGGCRVVYVCSDPKDAVVSQWLYTETKVRTRREAAHADDEQVMPPGELLEDEAFYLFCDGSCPGGPHWRHVLGYWEVSRASPHQVLFLWYDKVLADPVANVIALAEFLGFSFSREEATAAVELFPFPEAEGHLRSHLTKEMEARLDGVVAGALEGSGFSFAIAAAGDNRA